MDDLIEPYRKAPHERQDEIIFNLCVLCVFCGSFLFACAAPTSSPTPTPSIGTVTDQLARGATLYAQNCATANCHGTKGEGLRSGDSFTAFPLVGKDFQARNPNAQVVFDVVRSGGEQNLRALTDQQIYDAIVFELQENGAKLAAPLSAQRASMTPNSNLAFDPAAIYPPLDGVAYIVPPVPPRAFWIADNGYVELRVDQIAFASAINQQSPPRGGAYVIVVLALRDLTNHALDIDPKFLRLYDSIGSALEPQAIALHSPIEQFHHLTIQPDHGAAAIVVFALSSGATYDRIVYDDQTGHAVTLKFSQ